MNYTIWQNDFSDFSVIDEEGQVLASFDNDDAALHYLLSILTDEERKQYDEEMAEWEARQQIDAEDAANRRLSCDHYRGF